MINLNKAIKCEGTFLWSADGLNIAYEILNTQSQIKKGIYIFNFQNKTNNYLNNEKLVGWFNNTSIISENNFKDSTPITNLVDINTKNKQRYINNSMGFANIVSISPNKKKFIYVSSRGDLDRSIFDVLIIVEVDKNNYAKEFIIHVSKEAGNTNVIDWINDNQFVVKIGNHYKLFDITRINKIDITNKSQLEYYDKMEKMSKELRMYRLLSIKDIAIKIKGNFISYDGKFYVEEDPRKPVFNVKSINTGKIIYTISDVYDHEQIRWSPVENILAYIEDTYSGPLLRLLDFREMKI